jgi:hypothetical protein
MLTELSMRLPRAYLTLTLALVLLAPKDTVDADQRSPPRRVLFIGNSLTATNDLPSMVATIAASGGHLMKFKSVTAPNFGLSDHWSRGVRDVIEAYRGDAVVLQQGPSSLADSRAYLIQWSERFAPTIREAGGLPALFMVWPSRARLSAIGAVRESYEAAAERVDGAFLPAGEVWRELWRERPGMALYGADGFHPSYLGSVVAAVTIYATLFNARATDLPSRLEPRTPGLRGIRLGKEQARLIYDAVDRVLARYQ